ncbi:MAG TPA: hypothetical protein VJB35_05190 [Candidatus Nanoarchaeia archaeon]|nr:hypothetical protein [Candidatus Nanoarchaeia archaeon]
MIKPSVPSKIEIILNPYNKMIKDIHGNVSSEIKKLMEFGCDIIKFNSNGESFVYKKGIIQGYFENGTPLIKYDYTLKKEVLFK